MKKNKTIFFPVRYPNGIDFKDGFFQRVLAIDEILKKYNFDRIYVSKPKGFIFFPLTEEIKSGIFEISASEKNPIHLLYLLYVSTQSRAIYLHSIMRIKTPLHMLMFIFAKKKIIDLHGAVPEEVFLQGGVLRSKIFNKIERFILIHADIIISVTQSMTQHMIQKHRLKKKINIQLPIFSQKIGFSENKKYSKKIIYCGGLQKWQKISEMLKYVSKNKNKYEFTFLVPEPNELSMQYLAEHGEKFPGIVQAASPDEIGEWYKKNNFGLVLRDDIVVNRVACPTKLIEYLQYDLIPIVDDENIGDFKILGYQYIKHNEQLPDENHWQEMIVKNRKILEKLNNISNEGADLLIKSI